MDKSKYRIVAIALSVLAALVLAELALLSPGPRPSYVPQGGGYKTVTPWATPPADGALVNLGFEAPFICPGGAFCVAHGWTGWYLPPPACRPGDDGCPLACPSNCVKPNGRCEADTGCYWMQPEFAEVTLQWWRRVHSGTSAQKTFTYGRMGEWGVLQSAQVAPGSTVTFSIEAQGFMCDDWALCLGGDRSHYAPTATMNLRVGIDPTGGTSPTSTAVIWSAPADSFDVYTRFNVTAQTTTGRVTVFTSAAPRWPYAHTNNDVYWDDAQLEVSPGAPVTLHYQYIPFVSYSPYTPPPPVVRPTNRGGLHVEATGSHNGYGTLLQACADAGRPLGLIKVMCDGGSAMEAKSVSTQTVTVWRCPVYADDGDDMDNPPGDWQWTPEETQARALAWMEAMFPRWELDRQYIDYHEITNEANPTTALQWQNFASFNVACMQIAEAHGYKLAIGSFSSGTPEPEQMVLFQPALDYAIAHGHVLAVHDGSVDGDRPLFQQAYADATGLRWRMYAGPLPPVVVTEAYQPAFYQRPNVADLAWYEAQVGQDNVIGYALFTLGSYSFGGDEVNLVGQLPRIAAALGCPWPQSVYRRHAK